MMANKLRQFAHQGFTIVELLIVVVIIGVLVTVTIVVYNGIKGRAIDASLQADSSSAAKILAADYVVNGVYPATKAAANSGRGLPESNGNSFSYTPNNSANPPSYILVITNPASTNSYSITDTNPTPTLVSGSAPVITLHPAGWIDYTHTFTATASGSPTPTVQWQSSPDNSAWTNISGATSTSYLATSTPCTPIYLRAVFTNTNGTATTNSASFEGPCGD